MKKVITILFVATLLVASSRQAVALEPEQTTNKPFVELFENVVPATMTDNVFKLVGEDFMLITSGTEADFNTMTAGWGGWGILFNTPATWCMLRANRYTLEYIRNTKTYTLAFFEDEYNNQVLHFGLASGRNSDKMKTHQLTAVTTPLGNIAYEEASLIIECELIQLTTIQPGDFYTEEAKAFVASGYEEAKDYHKLVFGKITNVWRKK
ncbi:MAG: flavin reductase [Prevotellaceae bacterium]|jgi:flavin reductase (DIM6/NTAB) family NADH-FMN oxidoreductase RutF|nr:flavin reductase [Prevotellaceae bacterium]